MLALTLATSTAINASIGTGSSSYGVKASFFGCFGAGGVSVCFGAGFDEGFAGFFAGGGVKGAVVVVAVVVAEAVVAVAEVVTACVVAPGGEVDVVVSPPPELVVVGVVVVVVSVEVVVDVEVDVSVEVDVDVEVDVGVVVVDRQWFSLTPPLVPCGSQSFPFGFGSVVQFCPGELPSEHGVCPGGLGGFAASATAEATPAAMTTASTATMAIGRSPKSVFFKLLPFDGLRTTRIDRRKVSAGSDSAVGLPSCPSSG